MAEYLDFAGLSHYDEKIKQHTTIYKHFVTLFGPDPDMSTSGSVCFNYYSKSNTPIINFTELKKLNFPIQCSGFMGELDVSYIKKEGELIFAYTQVPRFQPVKNKAWEETSTDVTDVVTILN